MQSAAHWIHGQRLAVCTVLPVSEKCIGQKSNMTHPTGACLLYFDASLIYSTMHVSESAWLRTEERATVFTTELPSYRKVLLLYGNNRVKSAVVSVCSCL